MTEVSEGELAMLQRSVDALAAKVDKLAVEMADLKGRFKGGWLVVAALGSLVTVAAAALAAFRFHP